MRAYFTQAATKCKGLFTVKDILSPKPTVPTPPWTGPLSPDQKVAIIAFWKARLDAPAFRAQLAALPTQAEGRP